MIEEQYARSKRRLWPITWALFNSPSFYLRRRDDGQLVAGFSLRWS